MMDIKSQALSVEEMRRIKQRAMKKVKEIEKKIEVATEEGKARLLTIKVAEEKLVEAMKYAMEYERYATRWGIPKKETPPIPYMEELKSRFMDENKSWSRISTLRNEIHKTQNRIYRLERKRRERRKVDKGIYGEILFLKCRVSLLRRELRLHYLLLTDKEERDG